MGLTKSVLKRPVTVVMVILCLIVFGLQSVLGAKLGHILIIMTF